MLLLNLTTQSPIPIILLSCASATSGLLEISAHTHLYKCWALLRSCKMPSYSRYIYSLSLYCTNVLSTWSQVITNSANVLALLYNHTKKWADILVISVNIVKKCCDKIWTLWDILWSFFSPLISVSAAMFLSPDSVWSGLPSRELRWSKRSIDPNDLSNQSSVGFARTHTRWCRLQAWSDCIEIRNFDKLDCFMLCESEIAQLYIVGITNWRVSRMVSWSGVREPNATFT